MAQELYRVDADSPRIVRSTFGAGVPPGVDDIAYTINLSAGADHLVAGGPHERAVAELCAHIAT